MLQSEEHKDEELMNLLRSKVKSSRDLVLIFVARKNTCDFVTNMLNRVGFRAAAMHSDRDQKHREATLADFKDGRIPIMVIILTVFIFTTILKILLKPCHYVSTLTCQIIVQDHLTLQVADFSEVNKRVGPNKAAQEGFFLIYVGENRVLQENSQKLINVQFLIRLCRCFFPKKLIRFAAQLFGRSEQSEFLIVN